jgi:hypothetical protein
VSELEERIERLERRLRVFEDKDELAGLMNRYCRTADAKDWQAWSMCWTEDAELAFGPFGVHRGRETIRDVCSEAESPYQDMQHSMTNMQFEVEGDRATGTAYLWFAGIPNRDKPADHFEFGGPYRWEFIRTPEGWRLRRLELRLAWTAGSDNDAVFT